MDEIIDAQVFAARLIEQATASEALVDRGVVDEVAAKLVEGGRRFAQDVPAGLGDLGVNLSDAAELMLALRRVVRGGSKGISARQRRAARCRAPS